jgi:hypothetical protein
VPALAGLRFGLIRMKTEGSNIDYAEIGGCTSGRDDGTFDTFRYKSIHDVDKANFLLFL